MYDIPLAAKCNDAHPSAVGCYPFYESDPFVLSHSPHCYVIGNQPSFESSIVKGEGHFRCSTEFPAASGLVLNYTF